eukprot:365186_1
MKSLLILLLCGSCSYINIAELQCECNSNSFGRNILQSQCGDVHTCHQHTNLDDPVLSNNVYYDNSRCCFQINTSNRSHNRKLLTDDYNWFCNKTLWTSTSSNSWSYSNCSFTSSHFVTATVLWLGDNYPNSKSWHNYRITVLVKFNKGEDTGIIFRSRDRGRYINEGNKYLFMMYEDKIQFYKTHNNSNVLLSRDMGPNFFLNKTKNITIDIFENRFTVFIENEFIFEYVDNCYPLLTNGSVGLRSYIASATYQYISIDLNPSYLPPRKYDILNPLQQHALYSLYNATNGNYWYNKWNLTTIETYEACNRLCGIMCDNNSDIVSIALKNNNLTGTIPINIKYISSLYTLSLPRNNLEGEIPDIFDQLPFLIDFAISYNKLNSTLPNSLQYASKLAFIETEQNNLQGNIDPLSNLNQLRLLLIGNNNFSGTISNQFCNSNKMLEFYCQHNNHLNGTLPKCIGNWTKVTNLFMTNNNIEGELPLSLCNLTNVGKLQISGTNITSTIPQCISNLSNLYELVLSNNNLNSTIPSQICKLQKLKNLALSQNQMIGQIPSCIWNNLTNLQQIYLNSNKFTEIEINKYPTNLRIISIADNYLKGKIQ